MKKVIATLIVAVVATLMSANPNQTLGQLGAKGVSEVGGDPKYGHYLPRTNANGVLDPSFFSSSGLFSANSKYYYVDVTNGDDTTGNGTMAAPFATINKALSANVTAGASPLVIFLFPGTYSDSVTITNIAQTRISIIGLQTTITGTVNLNTTGTAVQVDFMGPEVTSSISGNGGGSTFTVTASDRADLADVAKGGATAVNLKLAPGSTGVGTGGTVTTYDVTANTTTYAPAVPADWNAAPALVKPALDELVSRVDTIEVSGVTQGANVGTAGVGIFKQKDIDTLQFYKLNGLDDNMISVVLDAVNDEIDLSLVDNSITNAKLTNMNQYELKGRISAGAGSPENIAPAALSPIINMAGAVMESDFDANTILKADADDTPIVLTVPEQTLVGRITGGIITALTPVQIRALINVEDGANNYTHPNHTGDVTSVGDGAQTIAPGVVTNAKLADMAAWSIKARDNAAAGVPTDETASTLTTDATPVSGDKVLGWKAAGELRVFDVSKIGGARGVYTTTSKDFTVGGPYKRVLLIFVDTTAGNATIVPPLAADFDKIEILKTASGNTVNITGTVNAVVNPTINTQYGRMVILSNGTTMYSPIDVTP